MKISLILRNCLYGVIIAMTITACSSDDNGGEGGSSQQPNVNKNTDYADAAATRIEVPHLRGGNSKFIVYRVNDRNFDKDGVNYSVEWDRDLKANRWTSYILTKQNIKGNVSRYNGDYYASETSAGSTYHFDLDNLSLSDYYTYSSNGNTYCYIHRAKGFDHGHICPSADRLYGNEINEQTFNITNMQPQYSVFNSGLWATMEGWIRNFVKSNKFGGSDTLFVCKGGTIDQPEQILSKLDGKFIIPKYFYATVVWKRSAINAYSGIAFWFEQANVNHGDDALKGYAISIDELEKKLGGNIDFFCNLPDDIETKVEKTAATLDFGL